MKKLIWTVAVSTMLAMPFYPGPVNAAGNDLKFGTKMLQYTNLLRKHLNVPSLKRDKCFDKAAYLKAQDMVRRNYFDHTYGDESFDRFVFQVGCPVHYLGENLSQGYDTPQGQYQSLKNSPEHFPIMTRIFTNDSALALYILTMVE